MHDNCLFLFAVCKLKRMHDQQSRIPKSLAETIPERPRTVPEQFRYDPERSRNVLRTMLERAPEKKS